VYVLLADDRELFYVGKAGDLRARLKQHASTIPGRREPRLARLYGCVNDVCWEELPDEATAAVREADLIVSLRPPFNAAHVAEGRWNFITGQTANSRPIAEPRSDPELLSTPMGDGVIPAIR
jgi:excinuclease UvrABC nuclease subunit